jgi:hypothetical protein
MKRTAVDMTLNRSRSGSVGSLNDLNDSDSNSSDSMSASRKKSRYGSALPQVLVSDIAFVASLIFLFLFSVCLFVCV